MRIALAAIVRSQSTEKARLSYSKLKPAKRIEWVKLGMHWFSGRFRWRIITVLCAVAFVLYIDRINIAVAAPRMAADFGLSHQSLGAILSAFLFGYAIGLVPGGWLADRFGPSRVLTIAGLGWVLITALTGSVPAHKPDPRLLLVPARFALGLCEACAYPTFSRAIANWMRQNERAKAMGFINGSSALGGSFTPMFIAVLITRQGWRESFVASGLVTLVVVVWWWRSATDRPDQHRRVTRAELLFITSGKEEECASLSDRNWYRRLIRSRSASMLCASEFFYGLAIFVFITWLYTYFVEVRKAGMIHAAMLSSVPYLGMAVGAPAGGLLSDYAVTRWGGTQGRRVVPLVALLLSGTCGILAPTIRNNTFSASVFALAAGLQFVAAAAFWATVIDITRSGSGLLGGLMNGSGNLAQAIGTVAFPWFVARIGWRLALQLAGSSSVIAGLIWLLIDASRQIDWRQVPGVESESAIDSGGGV
jgi:MFS family permease